jgi:hypothetical protein
MTAAATWSEQIRKLEGVSEDLTAAWRPAGATEAEVQDMNKLVLSILASGYLCRVYTDSSRPVFMPLWNYAFNQGGPNPDYLYSTTEIDSGGVYEISGFRGTSRLVEITQQSWDMFGVSGASTGAPLQETHELDELAIAGDGAFSVILSAQRPEGYLGDWWPLDTRCRRLLMRSCACDWEREVDARVAINRLDGFGVDMPSEAFARRFSELGEWIANTIRFDMNLVAYYREHHGVNVLLRSQRAGQGGGLAAKQANYDGIFEISDDEALIVEFPVPDECRYWQILVADDRFATVDWVNRQSSLNDVQAHVDTDGRFRAVVSKRDPGVYNWLDKADFPSGIIQARFYQASEYPDATVTTVPVGDVLEHLPPGTARVSPQERAELLRQRRRGAQLRHIW